MFKDTSTNGTSINNISIKQRAVPIHRGDIIMLAEKYPVNWNQIDIFFPPALPKPIVCVAENKVPPQPVAPVTDTNKWNWGAFGLYPLWGFFNGCWWAFLISIVAGWLYPIPNIIFGVYGTKWAWENRKWTNEQEFLQAQNNWKIWGIIVTCLNIVFYICWISVYAALLF